MRRNWILFLLLILSGCSHGESKAPAGDDRSSLIETKSSHPQVDFQHWATVFPIETFEKTSGPRRFLNPPAEEMDPNDVWNPHGEWERAIDLWKPRGKIITSPAHLCNIELVRTEYAGTKDLGRAVPVDVFLWSVRPPARSYLTKLGGVPHRESSRSWPANTYGRPCTFVGQFCFVDSRDVISDQIPGDVMLVFFGALKRSQEP